MAIAVGRTNPDPKSIQMITRPWDKAQTIPKCSTVLLTDPNGEFKELREAETLKAHQKLMEVAND